MSDKTGIAWTDATWNPVRGCSRVSAGCEHCYAERVAHRFSGPGGTYEGLTVSGTKGPRWTGRVRLLPELLDQPLRWRKPRRIFVNSMSDLFHDEVPDDFIDRVFGVMACAPHAFQILTKRPDRMRSYLREHAGGGRHVWTAAQAVKMPRGQHKPDRGWPLPNVWLGVSCEDQAAADERIPILLDTPAAVRFVSLEPLLGPISLDCTPRPAGWPAVIYDVSDGIDPLRYGRTRWIGGQRGHAGQHHGTGAADCPLELHHHHDDRCERGLDWVIVGGESGPKARPCVTDWVRSIVNECKGAAVPVFVKQLGANPFSITDATGRFRTHGGKRQVELVATKIPLASKAGSDPSEWPEDLRIQEFPR